MGDIPITTCPPTDQREALELVLSAIPVEQRSAVVEGLRPLAEQGVNVFAGLVVAKRDGKVAGAAWLQPQVGRTGTLWPSVVRHGISGSLKRDLAMAALKAELPVDLAQTLLGSRDDPFADDLRILGFTQLAELLYLSLNVPTTLNQGVVDPRMQLIPRATDDLKLLELLVTDSYVGTYDCPALEGLRGLDDTIAGYQAVGSHDESLWFVVHWDNEPAGVLFLGPYPESKQWELTYMGVIPEFRGLGIGGMMLAELHRRAKTAEIEQILLAVDVANQPARRIYESAGYIEWSRRTAFMKSFL